MVSERTAAVLGEGDGRRNEQPGEFPRFLSEPVAPVPSAVDPGQVAKRLTRAGARGKPVIVATDRTVDIVPAILGCFHSGCIAVPLGARDTTATPDLIGAIQRAAGATGASHLVRIGSGDIGTGDGLTVLDVDAAGAGRAVAPLSFEDFSAADIALIQHGSSRREWDGLAYTFGNLAAAADSIGALGIDPAGPLLWPLSAGFAGVVALTMAPPAQCPSHIILYSDAQDNGAASPLSQTLEVEGVSVLVAGDANLQALASAGRLTQSQHLLVEASGLTGAGMRLLSQLAIHPGRITVVYQPPAAALPVAARRYSETAVSDGRVCCGEPHAGHSVAIVDNGEFTTGSGEIWVCGTGIAREYWRNPERTERICRAYCGDSDQAYLRTGQSGQLGPGGLYVGGGDKTAVRREHVLEWLRGQTARAVGAAGGDIHESTPLTEYGFDSMMFANLVAEIESRFGISLPLASVHANLSIGELATRTVTSGAAGRRKRRHGSVALVDPDFSGQIDERLQALDECGLSNPYFQAHDSVAGASTSIGGRAHVNFASYNYLALCGDPRVDAAAKDAIDRLGTSVSASRLVSGERDVHRRLEQALAQFLGVEDCVVFVSGHLTNMTTLGQLAGAGDLIVYDELAHDSLLRGVQLSGAAGRPFPHNDCKALDALLNAIRADYRKTIIVAEGAYSMDGDVADLPGLLQVRQRHDAFVMMDEAHSIGVLGPGGRGVTEHFGLGGDSVDISMGTLSKALASCGGYIAGSAELVRYLKYNASGFVFSVGMPPSGAAAALRALELLQEEPGRIEKLSRNADLFRQLAREHRLDIGTSEASPIVPVILGDSMLSIALSERLGERGINVQPIVYPAVAEGAARLRFFICADHTDSQIADTVEALANELSALRQTFNPAPQAKEKRH